MNDKPIIEQKTGQLRRESDRYTASQIRTHMHMAMDIFAEDHDSSVGELNQIVCDLIASHRKKQQRLEWVGSSFSHAVMLALVAMAGAVIVIVWQHLTSN